MAMVVEVAVAATTLFSAFSLGAQTLPPAPCLTQSEMEKFEPSIRERVQKAYQAVQTHPTDPDAQGRLGMILHALKHEAAVNCYERALLLESSPSAGRTPSTRRTPSRLWTWAYYLGVFQLDSGRASQAVVSLRQASQLKPDYVPARLNLAKSLFESGEWEESQRIYQAVLNQYPEEALVKSGWKNQAALLHYGLGRIHSARGDLRAAAESYGRACRLTPGFAAAHYSLAIAYRDLGEAPKAQEQLSLFERHKEVKPPLEDPLMYEIETLKSGVRYHLDQGHRLQMAGQIRQAVAEFQRALKLNPDDVQVHVNLISAYLDLRNPEKAEEHYHAAIKLAPNTYQAHYNFGLVMIVQKRFGEAIDAFKKALQINPHHADSHKSLGLLLLEEGRMTEAETHLRRAIENKPHFGVPHFALGQVLQRRGQSAEAIDHFLRALTLEDTNDYLFLYSLADAYARSGNREKAADYARQAKQRAIALGQTTVVPEIEKFLKELEQTGRPK